MFNLQTASSGVKKAAYRAGVRSGMWKPVGRSDMPYEPFVEVHGDNGKVIEITPIDVELANDYTWQEIRSGR